MATDRSQLESLRRDYKLLTLSEADVNPDPIEQFRAWFDAAKSAGVAEPNAMTLATMRSDGTPSARIVLLKGLDSRGFAFYTNYESNKGQELSLNPSVALVFFWPALERQVRVEGSVRSLDRTEGEAYFCGRPRASQIGAWVSQQSRKIVSRDELEKSLAETEERFEGKPVPMPDYWGGYVVNPARVEFWQGRPSRLHDRLLYTRDGDAWNLTRLAP